MDQLINVFTSLGVDQSIFVQFGLVVFLYFILKSLLFSKLQFVLDLREGKTTKLETQADGVFLKAEKLAEEYNKKINGAKLEGHSNFLEKRSEIEKKVQATIKEMEKELGKNYKQEKELVVEDVQKFRESIFIEKKNFTEQLVSKLTSN